MDSSSIPFNNQVNRQVNNKVNSQVNNTSPVFNVPKADNNATPSSSSSTAASKAVNALAVVSVYFGKAIDWIASRAGGVIYLCVYAVTVLPVAVDALYLLYSFISNAIEWKLKVPPPPFATLVYCEGNYAGHTVGLLCSGPFVLIGSWLSSEGDKTLNEEIDKFWKWGVLRVTGLQKTTYQDALSTFAPTSVLDLDD